MKETFRWVMQNWFEIILFIGFYIIIYYGFNSLIWGGDDPFSIRIMATLFVAGGIFYLLSSKNKKIKIYEDVICVAASNYKGLIDDLRKPSIDTYSNTRDLSLAITIERKKITSDFSCDEKKIYPGIVSIVSMIDKENLEVITKLLENKRGYLGDKLSYLDKIILENCPHRVKREFPEVLYMVRLNWLDDFASYLLSGQENYQLVSCDPGTEPLHEFRERITEKYFKNQPNRPAFPTIEDVKRDGELFEWFKKQAEKRSDQCQS